MITKKYNLINNIGGWFAFLIALATYWLTLEPTASYWDCGEFIIQADKLEVGHPPGNPIFMLVGRFFVNFAPDPTYIPLMVNAMSGLLSALTILLLFWTISHLVRRLIVPDGFEGELPLYKYVVIMGSALVGSLAYTWSDTFWFSAVEGEVYAFSSFCTALVFWLILKWENRADQPHADRYLVLIAYIIGVSVAVHLLNLLCIPAIVLVFAYRKWNDMNLKKSIGALLVSFAIIFFVLYGLVPGFIKVAQQFELFFVNTCGMGFNSGALIYACAVTASFVWALYTLKKQSSANMIRISFLLAVALSGILWIGNGVALGIILFILLAVLLWTYFLHSVPVRVLSLITWSMAMIFVGYSSYALILIRSTADTPMNQNSPDNVFDLATYLNREQYGENPLLYGETLYSQVQKQQVGLYTDTLGHTQDGYPITLTTPQYNSVINPGKPLYVKGVKGAQTKSEYGFLSDSELATNTRLAETRKDYYVKKDYKSEPVYNPELNMLFPRIYSRQHESMYRQWVRLDTASSNLVEIHAIDQDGHKVPELDTSREPQYNEVTGRVMYPGKYVFKPSFAQNLAYFFNYQLNHMYMRYFMWNFAGRQNDVNNQSGELDAGNWISGIPFIDNARLGDQSLLPDDLGKDNPGHNVFYMLPLLLGLLGLCWQSFEGRRGIEQFWVIFFLFFMTGIAIVLYLNQVPNQPRERDYAFAGSFYAFAIWIGMGVAALWKILCYFTEKKPGKDVKEPTDNGKRETGNGKLPTAWIAAILSLLVPVQMVSQTWDDHDRSGRYAMRDFAINYLNSLEPNAIVFCNGDNDTFPLWYVQEVEGVRPDVKIINLSYLNSDWYANQQRQQSYDAAPVNFTAEPKDYAYGKLDVSLPGRGGAADLLTSLKALYAGQYDSRYGYPTLSASTLTIPVDKQKVLERGLVAPEDSTLIEDYIVTDLSQAAAVASKGYVGLGELLMLDIIATNAANGWERPIYWASTVGPDYHLGLTPYVRSTGMVHQLTPTIQPDMAPRTDRAYNVVKNYLWGGADKATDKDRIYYDETARRMLVSTRTSMIDVASQLLSEGDMARAAGDSAKAKQKYTQSAEIVDLMEKKLGDKAAPYSLSTALTLAQLNCELAGEDVLADKIRLEKGRKQLLALIDKYGQNVQYNRAMRYSFGNPSMTYENQLIPYQYYRFIELYHKYGKKDGGSDAIVKPSQSEGSVNATMPEVDAILQKYGLNEEELRRDYENYLRVRNGQPAPADDGITWEKFETEIAKYCEIANELASLSPEEYARRSAEEKQIDSVLYSVIEVFLEEGGNEENLQKYDQYRKLDKARAKRLSEQSQGL
ncbi:MAG: DUF2723 domain-containing protein [Muribaculaceae bacterium]|nr:DUF2723 domain-containing protein [Muribaculaceae bacterium]